MVLDPKLQKLYELRKQAKLGGGQKRNETQHKKGKLTARERIDLLLDENSFTEMDMFVRHRCTDFGLENENYLSDGVITGYGTIDQRVVFFFSGLHSFWWLTFRSLCREDLQNYGPCPQSGRPRNWHKRFRWRTHSGGR